MNAVVTLLRQQLMLHVRSRELHPSLLLSPLCTHTGGGLVFWHGNGAMIRHQIEMFWKDLHLQQGYDLVYSPHVAKIDLWKTSGHFDFYKESMFDQMQVGLSEGVLSE